MLAAVGKIIVVALYVRVKIPSKIIFFVTPAVMVPKAVIVVVPVMCTSSPVAVERSVVVALAIFADFTPSLIVPSLANSAFTSSIISPVSLRLMTSPESKL